jgi:hypothetical protein
MNNNIPLELLDPHWVSEAMEIGRNESSTEKNTNGKFIGQMKREGMGCDLESSTPRMQSRIKFNVAFHSFLSKTTFTPMIVSPRMKRCNAYPHDEVAFKFLAV